MASQSALASAVIVSGSPTASSPTPAPAAVPMETGFAYGALNDPRETRPPAERKGVPFQFEGERPLGFTLAGVPGLDEDGDYAMDDGKHAAGDRKSSSSSGPDVRSRHKQVEKQQPWRARRYAELSEAVSPPLHQICGAFPHGKHHAHLVHVESDIPFWILPNMNRQWVKDLDLDSPLVFKTVAGRQHLTLGRPTKAGQIWILRMTILAPILVLQFVLTDDGVPELHTAYPVLLSSRTNPVPIQIFRVQQWRNLVEANIQIRLHSPNPDDAAGSLGSDLALCAATTDADEDKKQSMKRDMQRYMDLTVYAVDYCSQQDGYRDGTIRRVLLTAIADKVILSPTSECPFSMLPQTQDGRPFLLTGDSADAFEGVLHLPQTFNPLMNAQVFGRIEHVEEIPGKVFGEVSGAEAYLLVVSVQRVAFELLVLKNNVLNGTDRPPAAAQAEPPAAAAGPIDGLAAAPPAPVGGPPPARTFRKGQRFWSKCWLQICTAAPENAAGHVWPRAVGPSSALESTDGPGAFGPHDPPAASSSRSSAAVVDPGGPVGSRTQQLQQQQGRGTLFVDTSSS